MVFLKSPEKLNHLSCAWWVHWHQWAPAVTPATALCPAMLLTHGKGTVEGQTSLPALRGTA